MGVKRRCPEVPSAKQNRSNLPITSEERKVEAAHYLIQTQGEDWLEPAHIEAIFDWMPHSHGRDILILAHWHGRLKQAGHDPWNAFGMCESFKYSDMERRAYKVLAYQAESVMRAARFHCTTEMHHRIAGLALTEMVLSDICETCNAVGCADCDYIGRKGWSQTKRIDMLETNSTCWGRTLGKAYQYSLLPSIASQEREAAKQFMRTAADRFGVRLEQLLCAMAIDPENIRAKRSQGGYKRYVVREERSEKRGGGAGKFDVVEHWSGFRGHDG